MLNSHSTSRAEINQKGYIKCKFCKGQCIEINPKNAWSTFVCFNCGGQAHIIAREKDYRIDDCRSQGVLIVTEIEWLKAKITIKHN